MSSVRMMPIRPVSNRPSSVFSATDIRIQAQTALAAAVQMQHGGLGDAAASQFAEWARANVYMRQITGEFDGSHADKVTRRAIGMLTRGQAAKDEAASQLALVLAEGAWLHEQLADRAWEASAAAIVTMVIHAYHAALMRGLE